jgi:Cft2 family RNA processing exonuclease
MQGKGAALSAADLVVRDRFGLFVPSAALHLDSRRSPGLVFVSHAHSDHCSSAPRIVCTPETAELHRRRRQRGSSTFTPLGWGERLPLRDATLELTPAGHTLGSAMAVVRSGAGTLVYTGDYKLRPGAFSPGVSVPRCDTLVMECTFGDSRYRFPPEDEVLAQLFAFIDETIAGGDTPVVLAYAFGKTQEALYHLTRRGYRVSVADPGAALCEAHERLGYMFPGPGSWQKLADTIEQDHVLLMTSRARHVLPRSRRYRCVHLTGWACSPYARRFVGSDFALPLSGHADFNELERTALESGARKVYTVHGSPRFAAHLRSLGVDAEHLVSEFRPRTERRPAERTRSNTVNTDPQLALDLS